MLKIPRLAYDYIIRSLLFPFVSGVIFITFVLIMFQVIRLANFAIVHGVSLIEVFRVFFYMFVSFLPMSIPISFLFSVLFVFGQLSMDNEIIAFRATGFSIRSLFVPVLFVAILVSLFTLRISMYEAPMSYQNVKRLLQHIGSKTVSLSVKPKFFNTDMVDGVVFYADRVERKRLYNVFIYDARDKDMPTSISAKRAVLNIDELSSETTISLYEGTAVIGKENFSIMHFAEYQALLLEAQNIGEIHMKYHYLDMDTLKNVLKRHTSQKALVEYYKRYAVGFSIIIFAFIGVLFGNFTGRSGRSVGLLSFIFVLVYWVLYVFGTSLGVKGVLPPFLGAWFANIVFTIIGLTYWRIKSFTL